MLTIGQVAKRADVAASAIRYYEERGLLPRAERRSGKRVYPDSVLKRLAVIEVAKAAGFELSEIAAMLSGISTAGPARTWKTAARAKQADIMSQMRTLARMSEILEGLQGCDCRTLEQCGAAFVHAIAKEPLDTPVKPQDVKRAARRRFSRR